LDKSVISRAVVVAGGRFAPGHLGELTQQDDYRVACVLLPFKDSTIEPGFTTFIYSYLV
jgi:hypothetical protein